MEAPQVARAAGESSQRLLSSIGLSTLSMAVSLLIYKPPHGALFEHHIALVLIFFAGVVEVWTALWVAEGEDQHDHRRAFGRAMLFVSVIPLAAVIGLGAVLVKG